MFIKKKSVFAMDESRIQTNPVDLAECHHAIQAFSMNSI